MTDFDRIIPRRGSHSYKWDSCPHDDIIPLWVADMDFQAAPCIIEALQRRVEHGVFGYVKVPESYYTATIRWFDRRHRLTLERDWFIYTSGVVPAISAILQAMTQQGDKVMVLSPVYNCFFSSIRNSGCQLVESHLVAHTTAATEQAPTLQTWQIDWEDVERKAADPAVKVFLLCNPHNPAGRVWTREELQRLGDICLRHQVFVLADEIHNELVMPGYTYTPYASLGGAYVQQSATCISPSKSFNIAGLQIANIIVADASIRERVDKQININEVCDVNPFGVEALQAAYSPQGEEWLEQLKAYLADNYAALLDFFRTRLPQLPVTHLEGTYLAWVDCKALGCASSTELEERLLEEARIWLNCGDMYDPQGSSYMRINLACPRAVLLEGLERLATWVEAQA